MRDRLLTERWERTEVVVVIIAPPRDVKYDQFVTCDNISNIVHDTKEERAYLQYPPRVILIVCYAPITLPPLHHD